MRNTGRLEICEVVDSRSASKASAGKQKIPNKMVKTQTRALSLYSHLMYLCQKFFGRTFHLG